MSGDQLESGGGDGGGPCRLVRFHPSDFPLLGSRSPPGLDGAVQSAFRGVKLAGGAAVESRSPQDLLRRHHAGRNRGRNHRDRHDPAGVWAYGVIAQIYARLVVLMVAYRGLQRPRWSGAFSVRRALQVGRWSTARYGTNLVGSFPTTALTFCSAVSLPGGDGLISGESPDGHAAFLIS